jgi:chromosome segregation ATPase
MIDSMMRNALQFKLLNDKTNNERKDEYFLIGVRRGKLVCITHDAPWYTKVWAAIKEFFLAIDTRPAAYKGLKDKVSAWKATSPVYKAIKEIFRKALAADLAQKDQELLQANQRFADIPTIEDLQATNTYLNHRLNKSEEQTDITQSEINKLAIENSSLSAQSADLQEQINTLKGEIAERDGALARSKQQIAIGNGTIVTLKQQIEERFPALQEMHEIATAKNEELQEQIEQLNEQIEQQNEQSEQLNEQLAKAMEGATQEKNQAEKENPQLKAEIEKQKKIIQNLSREKEALQVQLNMPRTKTLEELARTPTGSTTVSHVNSGNSTEIKKNLFHFAQQKATSPRDNSPSDGDNSPSNLEGSSPRDRF